MLTRSAISGRVSGWSNAPSAASIAASTTRLGTPFPRAQRLSFSARRAAHAQSLDQDLFAEGLRRRALREMVPRGPKGGNLIPDH